MEISAHLYDSRKSKPWLQAPDYGSRLGITLPESSSPPHSPTPYSLSNTLPSPRPRALALVSCSACLGGPTRQSRGAGGGAQPLGQRLHTG